ncbi:obscurin-like [Melanotaenia boesemani]|uniref:obscurin-like n=1 Tax=Melanotaenia boesemani TaxID=1250792 RepID=UPI001C0451BA|nr:obscurin-like [Melanotaenia boesemani]
MKKTKHKIMDFRGANNGPLPCTSEKQPYAAVSARLLIQSGNIPQKHSDTLSGLDVRMEQTLLCVMELLLISSLFHCGHAEGPQLSVSPSWLSPGSSVTLRCEIKPLSAGWRFYWYKAVPDLLHKNYSYDLLPGSTAGTEHDSYIIHKQTHTAGYVCRAGRGDPVDYTDYSEVKFVWSAGSHPAASLTVSPDREQHFTVDDISLNCGGSSAEWRVMRFTGGGFLSDCSSWGTMTGSRCSLNSRLYWRGVYWCESGSGEFSNAVNITRERPVLSVSPSWLSPGSSVTLRCEIKPPSAGWRFYWYKVVPDRLYNLYSYNVLPGSTAGTEHDSYIIHGQTHTTGYVCRAGRGDPEYHTDYSQPKFVWSADVHPAASLKLNPDRVQHFRYDSVSLNCRGNSAKWMVRRFTELGHLSRCSYWGTMIGSSCNMNMNWYDSGVYWCESGSGEFSNTVNITVQNDDDDGVILVSPVHPVTEGASVSLSCRRREQNTLSSVSFYHNDKLLQHDGREELNISAVSQSDEGFYKCQHAGKTSQQSWMSVTAAVSRPENSSFPLLLIVGPVAGIVFILLILLCWYRRSKGFSTEQTVNQCENQQQVYSSLLHGDISVYERIRRNENSPDGQQEDDYAVISLT